MTAVEKRVGDLVEEHLGISDRSALDTNVRELGVNSMDAVNFLKTINQEFSVNISPEEAANFSKLRDLVNHLGG
ncbi:MAG: acyl carrier protein [Gammaproteobacteria bacterium]|nr:acyl carrier protein [Gammaproteobacteria bacterium]